MYTIQATDEARTQEKRLNCTESEARKRMQEYFENDYFTEIATERQKAAEKIIKDHEKWERKFFKRIFKKGIDNKQ